MDVRVGLLSCNTDRKDASSIRGVMVKNMKLWQSERRNVYLSLRSELGQWGDQPWAAVIIKADV